MSESGVRRVDTAIRLLLERQPRLVLAVSGGLDSAVMLDAVARLRRQTHHVVVASVDHATGEHATLATAETAATAAAAGMPVVTERLAAGPRREAAWRAARWRFLRTVAVMERAPVATAHTRDDQVETVVMRILRGTSARGLAGLYAPSSVERPLLELGRDDLMEYAARRGVRYADDPSNRSTAFFRNRVRLNLLPAIRAVHPGFDEEILALSRRAAAIRSAVELAVESLVLEPRPLRIDAGTLEWLSAEERRLVWPALVARLGVPLDRSGVARLADLVDRPTGARAQFSGGLEAVRGRTDLTLRRLPVTQNPHSVRLQDGVTYGEFRFQARPAATIKESALEAPPLERSGRPEVARADGRDPWTISLPAGKEAVVRGWAPGDRLSTDSRGSRRRVKRFLADAGIVGPLRRHWPVVVVGDDIVWIPGVRACPEAVQADGAMIEFRCERILE